MNSHLRAIYKSKEVSKLARAAAAKDWHRQQLLKRYTRIQDVLGSRHPWAILAPIRRYALSIIACRLERNTIKHLHRSTQLYLKRLTRLNSLSWAYKNLTRKPR